MRIAVITCPRPNGEDYLTGTLDSCMDERSGLLPQDEMLVCSESEAPPGVPKGVAVVTRTTEELVSIRSQRAIGTYNFIRALQWGKDGNGPVCVFEDDIELAKGWAYKVRALSAAADRHFSGRWMLSLLHFYHPWDFGHVEQTDGGALTVWYHPEAFYGSQALVMPPAIAGEFAEALRIARTSSDLQVLAEWRSDMAIKPFVKHFHVTLLACHPCHAQHVDGISTWLGVGKRALRAPHYEPDESYRKPSCELVKHESVVRKQRRSPIFRLRKIVP